jgi:hypothetical protein
MARPDTRISRDKTAGKSHERTSLGSMNYKRFRQGADGVAVYGEHP